jgi:hypothetical protein
MCSNPNRRWAAAGCVGLTLLLLSVAPTMAQTAFQPESEVPTAQAIDSRLANVERLIEQSSGARRIQASGVPEALAHRERALVLHGEARERRAAGDLAGCARLLDEATREMMRAIRLAGRTPDMDDKKRRDFSEREQSIAALLEALERIGAEKGAADMAARVEADVNALVTKARQLEQAGRLDEGRRSLNAAYEMAKGAIEELRGGDTLVRALEFANKEEEYRYELDRNDTHQMLITVLVEEKRSSSGVDQMVTKHVQRAEALRGEAERQAGAGDFAKAVATLEQSTKELVRAIRSAGIYIPG